MNEQDRNDRLNAKITFAAGMVQFIDTHNDRYVSINPRFISVVYRVNDETTEIHTTQWAIKVAHSYNEVMIALSEWYRAQ